MGLERVSFHIRFNYTVYIGEKGFVPMLWDFGIPRLQQFRIKKYSHVAKLRRHGLLQLLNRRHIRKDRECIVPDMDEQKDLVLGAGVQSQFHDKSPEIFAMICRPSHVMPRSY